jgi:hypothetical protein
MRTGIPPLIRASLLVVLVLGSASRAAAQATVAGTIDATFGMVDWSFVRLAEAMPAANVAFFNQIEGKTPPDGCEVGGPHPAKTKAELVAYLQESFAYARKVLATITVANALEPAGGPYGGKSTRLGIATLAVWHASDHYGQLVVYARLSGVTPPASAR